MPMLHLKNGTFIHWHSRKFIKTDIWVEKGEQGTIHFEQPAGLHIPVKIIDCTGLFITRSLVNAHHHIYSALACGMPQPPKTPADFQQVLEYIWWKLDFALDEEMIRSSALVTALAAARSGCSFIIDHHSSPAHIEGSLEIIARALNEAGLGHLLAYEITDRNGKEKTQQSLNETRSYLKNHQGLVGLHASFTLEDDTLLQALDIARSAGTGIHSHLAEDVADQKLCIQKYGKRVVNRFMDLGFLNLQKNIFVHALHLNEEEKELLKNSPSFIAVNYDSNLNNKVGIFNGEGLGENIMLGTDGMHSDMFASARTAWFTGMNNEKLDPVIVYNRLRRAHHYLENNGFRGDGENNLMILDYPSPTPFNKDNFIGHFFYGINSSHVKHLVSQGRLVMENRKHAWLDEERILHDARKQAEKLWCRL